jgi:hypothetical protein
MCRYERLTRQNLTVLPSDEGPIFLLDGGDVIVFATVTQACQDIESWMADQPVEFYDALARPLQLNVEGEATSGLSVRRGGPEPEHLRDALTTYLREVGGEVPDAEDITAFARAAARNIVERETRGGT